MTSELLERFPTECGVEQNRLLAHMQQFLATNKDLQAAKHTIGPCISAFDPELACQPQGIFCKVCCLSDALRAVSMVLRSPHDPEITPFLQFPHAHQFNTDKPCETECLRSVRPSAITMSGSHTNNQHSLESSRSCIADNDGLRRGCSWWAGRRRGLALRGRPRICWTG